MKKNKLIALGIIVVLFFTFFQWGFMNISMDSAFLQVISMAIAVLGTGVAIVIFNKGESSH